MTAIIEMREASKWYGEVVALNNLTVSIDEGVTGLLGPNGAGKSTFIKLAMGLLRPSRGIVRVVGGAPRNNPAVLRRIGYCPEVDAFHENMTGYEFVYWLSRFWGMSRREGHRAAAAACEMAGMTSRMHDPIEEYSKGMRQRIKLAQALALQPELLFLDEPMTGLDPKGREEMYALIRQLGAAGRSVVVSSHILYEIERITDNVVLLYNGNLIAQGRVREIRDLMDKHPRTITVDSPAARTLAAEFITLEGVTGVDLKDGAAVIHTLAPNECYGRLTELAASGAAEVRGIRCADDNLQAVFDYLVS